MNRDEWLDIICVKYRLGNRRLCEAPWYSHIEIGDEVITETDEPGGIDRGAVMAVYSCRHDSEVVQFLKLAFDEKEFRKVVGHFHFIAIEWEDNKDEVQKTDQE